VISFAIGAISQRIFSKYRIKIKIERRNKKEAK